MVRTAWMIIVLLAASGPAWAQATRPGPTSRPGPATQPAPESADAPTYITLHVKNAKGSDVLKEISRQAKMRVQGWPDFFWNGQQPGLIPPVTLDLDHVTFWNAIESICKITHTHPQFIGQPNEISLLMGNLGNWDLEGRFAFLPSSISRSSQIDLTTGAAHKIAMLSLSVFVDPKLHAQRWDFPHLTVAEDEHGKSLIPRGPIDTSVYPMGMQQPWNMDVSIPLAFPPGYGNTLARLQGTVAIHPADHVDVMQIKDLAKSIGSQATEANYKVDVLAFSFDGDKTVSMHLRISRVETDGKKSPPRMLQDIQSIRVVDAAGQQLPPVGHADRSDTQLDWTGTFTAAKPPKPPFALRWPIGTPVDAVVVPFNFTGLPLPPH